MKLNEHFIIAGRFPEFFRERFVYAALSGMGRDSIPH
jgi:hypothetical protein